MFWSIIVFLFLGIKDIWVYTEDVQLLSSVIKVQSLDIYGTQF